MEQRPNFSARLLAVVSAVALAWIANVNAQDQDPRVLTMTLPNGTTVPFTFRVAQVAMPNVQAGEQLAPMYDDLVEQANAGNIMAARFLGQALDVCRGAFSTDAELASAIQTLRTTGFRTYGDAREPEQYNGIATSEVETAMHKQQAFCEGVSKSTAATASTWTKKAVDAGDYYALQRWIRNIGRNNDSFELWHDAFERGYVWAAQELAYYYLNGIGGGMGGKPDSFHAYVYQTIAFKFEEATLDPERSETFDATVAEYDAVLSDLAARLRPEELERAHDEIVSIMSRNRQCCVVPGG